MTLNWGVRKRAARAKQAESRQQRDKDERAHCFQELPCSSNSIQNKERQITLRKAKDWPLTPIGFIQCA